MAQTSALKRGLAVVGVLLIMLALGWWVLHTDGSDIGVRAAPLTKPSTREAAAANLPAPAASPPLVVTPLVLDAMSPTTTRSAESANDGIPSGSLTVRVRWSDRSVAAGINLSVIDWHRPNATELVLRATTDAAGEAHFARVAAGSLFVQPDRCDGVMVTLPPGEEQLVELVIPPGFAIVGRVVDEQGTGIADAVVSLSDPGTYDLWRDLSRTDARGDFLLRDAGSSRFVCARAGGYSASDTLDVSAWADGDALEIVLRAPCGAVLAAASRSAARGWCSIRPTMRTSSTSARPSL